MPKRNVFISFFQGDRADVDAFIDRWAYREGVFTPKVLGVSGNDDFINSNNPECSGQSVGKYYPRPYYPHRRRILPSQDTGSGRARIRFPGGFHEIRDDQAIDLRRRPPAGGGLGQLRVRATGRRHHLAEN